MNVPGREERLLVEVGVTRRGEAIDIIGVRAVDTGDVTADMAVLTVLLGGDCTERARAERVEGDVWPTETKGNNEQIEPSIDHN